MHLPSSTKSSLQSQKKHALAEWVPACGVVGMLLGAISVCVVLFHANSFTCQTELSQPCSSELQEALQRLTNQRLLFSNQDWQSELETYGYSPRPVRFSLNLPDSISMVLREQAPIYQMSTSNQLFSVNSAGFVIKNNQDPNFSNLVQLADPSLIEQISISQVVPQNIHTNILTTLQQLDSLSLSIASLQLLPENTLLIQLTPSLWARASISDSSSLDRLRVILTSSQLTLEDGQIYELDTRFAHPVLRKRL